MNIIKSELLASLILASAFLIGEGRANLAEPNQMPGSETLTPAAKTSSMPPVAIPTRLEAPTAKAKPTPFVIPTTPDSPETPAAPPSAPEPPKVELPTTNRQTTQEAETRTPAADQTMQPSQAVTGPTGIYR